MELVSTNGSNLNGMYAPRARAVFLFLFFRHCDPQVVPRESYTMAAGKNRLENGKFPVCGLI